RPANDDLARELHAGRAQAQRKDTVAADAPKPAVEVTDRNREEKAPEEAQHGIAEPAVQEGHRAVLDAAREAVSHDEIGATAKRGNERLEVREVVAAVGVAGDDERAACGANAALQRPAVTPLGDPNDTRAARERAGG